MNTVVRALPHSFATRTQDKVQMTKKVWQVILLIVAVLLTAFTVVYVTDLHRRLFIQYQNLQNEQNQIYIDWGKLLLEQSTWSTQARVQTIAKQRLDMDIPVADKIVMVE